MDDDENDNENENVQVRTPLHRRNTSSDALTTPRSRTPYLAAPAALSQTAPFYSSSRSNSSNAQRSGGAAARTAPGGYLPVVAHHHSSSPSSTSSSSSSSSSSSVAAVAAATNGIKFSTTSSNISTPSNSDSDSGPESASESSSLSRRLHFAATTTTTAPASTRTSLRLDFDASVHDRSHSEFDPNAASNSSSSDTRAAPWYHDAFASEPNQHRLVDGRSSGFLSSKRPARRRSMRGYTASVAATEAAASTPVPGASADSRAEHHDYSAADMAGSPTTTTAAMSNASSSASNGKENGNGNGNGNASNGKHTSMLPRSSRQQNSSSRSRTDLCDCASKRPGFSHHLLVAFSVFFFPFSFCLSRRFRRAVRAFLSPDKTPQSRVIPFPNYTLPRPAPSPEAAFSTSNPISNSFLPSKVASASTASLLQSQLHQQQQQPPNSNYQLQQHANNDLLSPPTSATMALLDVERQNLQISQSTPAYCDQANSPFSKNDANSPSPRCRFCAKYPENQIVNRKYTLLSFFPLVLYSQFKYFLNLYFLLVALTQFYPALQVGYLFTYFAPLGFVISVSMYFEARDDMRRRKLDFELNSEPFTIIDPKTLSRRSVPSSELAVGDFVLLNKNQRVPADILLLQTAEKSGSCFIRTDQLDGETDWKLRIAISCTQNLPSEEQVVMLNACVEAEPPSVDIHAFCGYLQQNTVSSDLTNTTTATFPVAVENMLWRNTVLASDTILGLVVYTGRDTRASMNSGIARKKIGLVDEEVNSMSKFLSIFSVACAGFMVALSSSRGFTAFVNCVRFTIIFSNIIPISLRMNLEVAKFCHSMFISRDKKIPDTIVRTSSIPEELGRISYLLTDKTGTLTKNEMEMKRLHLGTMSFNSESFNEIRASVHAAFTPRANQHNSTAHQRQGSAASIGAQGTGFTNILSKNHAFGSSGSSKIRLVDTIFALALCHNVNPTLETQSSETNNENLLAADNEEELGIATNRRKSESKYKPKKLTSQQKKKSPNQTLPTIMSNILPTWLSSKDNSKMHLDGLNSSTEEILPHPRGNSGTLDESTPVSPITSRATVNTSTLSHAESQPRNRNASGAAKRPLSNASKETGILCLDVGADGNGTGKEQEAQNGVTVTYRAASPDEIALVKWANEMGVQLVSRELKSMALSVCGSTLNFNILEVFPFTSESKRMGIVLQDANTREIVFYEKGADMVMSKIVAYNDWLLEECENMAREGLRTLVIARKRLSPEYYDSFQRELNTAKSNMTNRNALVSSVVARYLERDMELLALTGVEDKLQDGVRASLETLRNAGIRVWMLTGDKMETARSIALSSKLVSRKMFLYEVSGAKVKTEEDAVNALLSFNAVTEGCLLIDGDALAVCMKHCEKQFFDLATRLATVVCCRCAPTQKTLVTKMLRNKKTRVACIGDGGNDVGMIQEAHVGIGIVGKEGLQASLASDFSITQFSHVVRLLLWHGRNSYRRSAKLSQMLIHRGLLISVVQAVFSAVFYFAPIALYSGMLLIGYSTIYTNFPLFFNIVWDRDVPSDIAMLYPELYKDLVRGKYLSTKTFCFWALISCFQGGAAMILTIYFFEKDFRHIVMISFTAMMLIVWITIADEIVTWRKFMVGWFALSVAFYFISWVVIPEVFSTISFAASGVFWMKVLATTAASCGPIVVCRFIKNRIWPPSYKKLARTR